MRGAGLAKEAVAVEEIERHRNEQRHHDNIKKLAILKKLKESHNKPRDTMEARLVDNLNNRDSVNHAEDLELVDKKKNHGVRNLVKKMIATGRDVSSKHAFDEAKDLIKVHGPRKDKKFKDIKTFRDLRESSGAKAFKRDRMIHRMSKAHDEKIYNDYKIINDMEDIKDVRLAKLHDLKQADEVKTRLAEIDLMLKELRKDLAERI